MLTDDLIGIERSKTVVIIDRWVNLFAYCELPFTQKTISKQDVRGKSYREQVNPTINYDYSFTSFYTYKIVGKHFSSTFIDTIVFTFLGASLGINAFFHFLM